MNIIATDNASVEIDNIGAAATRAGSSFTELNQAIEIAQKAFGILVDFTEAYIKSAVEGVRIAEEHARAERDLTVALKAHGDATASSLPGLLAFDQHIQNVTGATKASIEAMQQRLLALGVEPGLLRTATIAALGWQRTVKEGGDASRDVAKVIAGNANALERLGLHFRTSGEALEFMSRGFAQLEADSGTLVGRVRIASADFGDLRAAMGAATNESQALKDAVSAVSTTLRRFTELASSESGKAAINGLFRDAAALASRLVGFSAAAVLALEKLSNPLDQIARRDEANGRAREVQRLREQLSFVRDAQTRKVILGEIEEAEKKAEASRRAETTAAQNTALVLLDLQSRLKDISKETDPDQERIAAGWNAALSAMQGGAERYLNNLTKTAQTADDKVAKAAERAWAAEQRARLIIEEEETRNYERAVKQELVAAENLALAKQALRKHDFAQVQILEAEKATGQRRRDDEELARFKKHQAEIKRTAEQVIGYLDSAVDTFVSSIDQGFDHIDDAFKHLAEQIIADLIKIGIQKAILAAIGGIGLGAGGGAGILLGGLGSSILDAIGGGSSGPSFGSPQPEVPHFARGGTVPGPSGAPVLAVVHGGETIVPEGRGGGDTYHLHVHNNGISLSDEERLVDERLMPIIHKLQRDGRRRR